MMYDETFTCPKCGQYGECTTHGQLTLCDACLDALGQHWATSQQIDWHAVIAAGLEKEK